jgi:hypothetical protein
MPKPTVVFAALFAAGVVALVVFALTERRDEAFTLGVGPALPLAVPAGKTLCQGPIDVPAEFDRAEVTPAEPGATPDVVVRDARTHRRIEPPVHEGRRIEVCVEGRATVLGNSELAARSSEARLDGRSIQADISVSFKRAESRSMLELAPAIITRAALFHGSWVKPWVLGLLGVLLLTAFPLLLGVALRESSR